MVISNQGGIVTLGVNLCFQPVCRLHAAATTIPAASSTPPSPSPTTTTASTPSPTTVTPSPTTATPKTRTITDAAGRVVEIPYVVTRVADAWPANNGMVLMLGGADKLVGTVRQAQNQPWLRKLYPRIMDVPVVINASNDVNIETLIGTHRTSSS